MEKLTECERLCSLVCWVRIKQLLWVSNWQTNVYPLSHFILSVSLSVNSMNEQMKEFSNFGELFLLYNILVNKNSHLLFWLVMNVNANKNTSNSFYLKFLRKNVCFCLCFCCPHTIVIYSCICAICCTPIIFCDLSWYRARKSFDQFKLFGFVVKTEKNK